MKREVDETHPDRVTWYEGIACQEAADAIRESVRTLGPIRAIDAAREAARMGYVTPAELAEIEREVGAHV